MNFEEYRTYDTTGLVKLVADREVSPVQLPSLARERAAAANPRINAIVCDVPAAPPDDLSGTSRVTTRALPWSDRVAPI